MEESQNFLFFFFTAVYRMAVIRILLGYLQTCDNFFLRNFRRGDKGGYK